MAERSNAAVLKTVDGQLSRGSNPFLSAKKCSVLLHAVFFDIGYEEALRFVRGRSPMLCRGSRRETAESLSLRQVKLIKTPYQFFIIYYMFFLS